MVGEGFCLSVAIKLLKDGCGRVEVPDGWRGVGKLLQDGWGNGWEKVVVACRLVVSASGLGNGCVVVELALRLPRRRADVRPWTLPLRGEHVEEIVAI